MAVIRATSGRVAVLEAGQLVEIGPVRRVFGRPQHPVTQALLGKPGAADEFPVASGEQVVVMTFDGVTPREPDMMAISQALGPGARLVQGAVERIQGRAQGRLAFALLDGGDARSPALTISRSTSRRLGKEFTIMPGSLFDVFLIALKETAWMIAASGGLTLLFELPLGLLLTATSRGGVLAAPFVHVPLAGIVNAICLMYFYRKYILSLTIRILQD